MSVHAVISSTGHRRIHFAQRWLANRAAAEEVLIVGATLDAANELARKVAKKKGAAFGWHRLALPQLAFAVAAPTLAARGLTPLSRIGVAALVARLVHRMNAEGRLSHYRSVVTTPGFPRAVAGVITELRLARISLDAIGACAPDLERLIGAFETELKEAGVTDWPGVLSLASEAASGVGGNRPRLTGLPTLFLDVPAFLVIDDTTLPKKGTHSVGVAPQYASALGKTANCQTLVSLTLARGEVPVMVGLRLFLPETWTGDEARLERAGVPAEYRLARTKSEIALAELDRLIAAGVRFGAVLADAGYGMGAEFRQALSARRLAWAVGIPRHQKVYPRDVELVFPVAARGRPRKRHVPNVLSVSAEDMLTQTKWRMLAWRKGTKGPLKARFAAVRVRVADGPPQRIGDKGMQHMPGDEIWLVGERRASGEQKYYLANLPADADLRTLAATIKARWVCEQAHQQLKEELGLDHFEGRSWRGLHRHALMAMIAYAFLQHRRLAAASGGKKNRRRATSANAAGHTKSHRRSPGARSALPMPALPPTNPQIARMKVPK